MIERSIGVHRAIHRQAPGRLARARPDRDLRDAGTARRRRRSNTSATGSMTTSRPRSAPRNGPLVTLPYTVELNDIPMMLVQHHESAYFTQRCIDTFDRLYQEGAERAKIMAIAIHPYITGQPHRIKYLEAVYDHINRHAGVLHWNGGEILDWYTGSARSEWRPSHAADRTPRLFADRSGRTLKLPGGARLVVWVIVNVEEWDIKRDDAAHGADPAGRRLADARHPELGVARIRQPRRLLAHARGVRRAVGSAPCSRSTARRSPPMSRSPRAALEPRLGIHRPRLHPEEHAEGRRTSATTSARPPRRSATSPAGTRAAGWARASPRPGRRPTCWSRRATTTSATGCSTTSRSC